MNEELQALLDKQAITELVYRYARAADRHDHATLRSLYHDDATDDHGAFFKGSAMAFIDRLPEIQGPMKILHHNVTTINIELDGDYAEGEIYVIAYHQVETDAEPLDLLIGGRYLDRYARRDGAWKFAERVVLADWATVDQPSRVNLRHPLVEGSHIGQPGQADPSYDFFKLIRPGQ